jgi:ubiquitin C-terminal hydrolase
LFLPNYNFPVGTVNPRPLFQAIVRRVPRFDGYQQQDAQELMSFLLDGLHEDLNRVKIKPLVPSKEYNDVSTEHAEQLASQESWRDHLNRN